jgi:hypothetical protein
MPHRRLQDNATCFCDVNIIFNRAPTDDEFFEALIVQVEGLQLDSVKTVLGVSEPTVPLSFPPTPSPATEPPGQSILIEIEYQVAFRNGQNGTFIDDLIGAFDLLITQVLSEIFPDAGRRRQPVARRQLVAISLSTSEVTSEPGSEYSH